jgi:hypothetical protein
VLNGNNTTLSNLDTPTPETPSFVTKTDRHLQLINTAVFEKESLNRAKAMEETRKLKLKQRDEREKAKVRKHFQRMAGNSSYTTAPRSATIPANHDISIDGIRFYVTHGGSKLVKFTGEGGSQIWTKFFDKHYSSLVSDDPHPASATPRIYSLRGVKFRRTKNGNLIRQGALRYGRSLRDSGTLLVRYK